jgi:nitrite reductase (NADH) large subunit
MKKIVIIGNSVAGLSAAEEIRKSDPESEIIVFCEEPNPPVRRELFAGFLAKDVPEKDLLYKSPEFYAKERIGLVTDKSVIKFNFNRKYLTTDDKEKTNYDVLILTDTADTKLPDIKGVNKTGVFGLRKFEDVKNIQKHLVFVETAVVLTRSIEGIETACALKKRGKETILISSGPTLLPEFLDEGSSALIVQALEALGIRVLTGTMIEEILGDADLKAVRLNSGKVVACETVLFPDAKPSLKKLLDSDIEINDRVCVDGDFRTNIDNVFAAADVCEIRGHQDQDADFVIEDVSSLKEQGRIIAGQVLSRPVAPVAVVPARTLVIGGLSVALLGAQPAKDRTSVLLRKENAPLDTGEELI